MSNDLELLHEGFKNELNELESLKQRVDKFTLKVQRSSVEKELGYIISNLEGLCDSLYVEFENSHESEYEELKQNYEILREWINERATDDDVLDFKLRHKIDITDWK